MAAALRDGLVAEGATVLDAGMVATEMLYYLVGSRELDGGAMVTASHNPKAYTGVKLVREGALALSGDAGIGDVRELGSSRAAATPPGGGSVEAVDVYDEFHAPRALASIDPANVKPLKVVVDGGNGMAGPMVGPILERLGLDLVEMYFDARRRVPRPRAEPAAAGEPAVRSSTGCSARAPTSGSPGTATPTAASSSTTAASSVDGDFLTALLARAVLAKKPGATILYDVRASRAVPDTGRGRGRHRARQPGRPRLLQAGDARARAPPSAARSPATTTSATSGARTRARSRRCWCSSCSGSRAGRCRSWSASSASRYFISGEINSEVADQEAKMKEIAERYADGEITWLDGVSVDYPDWHFNVRPSNTEPLLRLNLESLVSREDMEAKRDEVLALIRA